MGRGGALSVATGADALWIWGCASVPLWPRLASYSYVALIPVLLFLLPRLGAKRVGLITLVWMGPLPWMMREVALGTSGSLEIWVSWFVGWGLLAYVGREFLQRPEIMGEPMRRQDESDGEKPPGS